MKLFSNLINRSIRHKSEQRKYFAKYRDMTEEEIAISVSDLTQEEIDIGKAIAELAKQLVGHARVDL